jgi:tellurite resistance protein
MLNTWYSQFGGYFWMVGVAVLTYFVMIVVKKFFTPLTNKLASTQKERRFANALLGMVFSVAIGLGLGNLGNMLFGTDVFFMWFVGGGFIAHYSNLLIRKYKDAEASAFAKAFIRAMQESNMDVSEDDLPEISNGLVDIIKAWADKNANSRKNKMRGVASGIAGSVEITDDEQMELEKHINAIKSSGKFDANAIANLDSAYAKAKADGKITVAEKANLEAVIRAIHNATNI